MHRTYELTESDMNKPYICTFDGDTFIYTVYESETEKQKDAARREKIENEYKRSKAALKESNLY